MKESSIRDVEEVPAGAPSRGRPAQPGCLPAVEMLEFVTV